MSKEPRLAVLDPELNSIARQLARQKPSRNRAARAVAANVLEVEDVTDSAVHPGVEVQQSLKLWVQPGFEKKVEEWIRQQGGKVVSSGERILVAELPISSLSALEEVEGIRRAGAPKRLLPCLEHCRGPATGLGQALQRHSRTGKGVVVGIIDTGVDWSHPDFVAADGTSRIELFLHAYRNGTVSRYRAYDQNKLNEALGQPQKRVPLGDPDGHGTHCASIAAGNGQASGGRFCGVAPEATLMAVRSEPLLDDHIIRAIRDIFRRAGKRPAVISLSLGHHYGAHDGTASLENVIAEQSGPGRIVVVAAGNEGDAGIHWHGQLVENEDLVIPFRIADRWQFVDVWIPRGDEVEAFVESPAGQNVALNGEGMQTDGGTCTATWRRDPVNLDGNLNVIVEDGSVGETWNIRLRPSVVLHGEVHAWSGMDDPAVSVKPFPPAAKGPRLYSIGIPATEERAISVASWVCRDSYEGKEGMVQTGSTVGQLSPFSSEGPTRHGILKPDIAAPGQYITAALASGSNKAGEKLRARHLPTAPYITLQGTSMATPFVAGVIALMLEKEPKLTPEEIQQRLRITARRDRDTRRVWGTGFGWGKIDVEALLSYKS